MKNLSISKTLVLLLLSFTAASCVDHAYDLDNVDRSAKLFDDITLPLGSTDKITIGDLIDEQIGQADDMIVKNSNGTYSISYSSDPYDMSFAVPQNIDRSLGLKSYMGKYIDVDFSLLSKPSSVQFDANGVADLSKRISASRKIPTKAYRLPFTIPKMPKQLNGLESVLLSNDSEVKISFSVPNCLLTDGTITPNIDFDLHELFGIAGCPSGVVNFSDVVLSKSNGFKGSKSLKLTKIVIDPSKFDVNTRTLEISAHISLSGTIQIDGPKTTREQYQKAPNANSLVVRIQLVNVKCQGIEGKFIYEVDSVRTRLKLTKVAKKFGGDDTPILFSSPELWLTYIGDFSVPTRATATFVAKRDGVTTAQIGNVPFNLPVSNGTTKAKRQYRFCSTGKSSGSAVGVKANIPALFKPFPDTIYVYLDIATDRNKNGTLDLDKKYALQLELKITSPLAYGPGLKLETTKTVPLPKAIGQLLTDNSLKLVGDITNATPMTLDMDFALTDEAGNALYPANAQTIAASSTTDIELAFSPVGSATAGKLSKATLHLQATPQTGKAINANDYLQANLQFQIPGGIHFTF
ncbi:MAG: hypothetical protein IKX53_09340 [Bacteroidales bacterium]|nr:hypothetical protein [Bacteroidales bacterium]